LDQRVSLTDFFNNDDIDDATDATDTMSLTQCQWPCHCIAT